MRINTNNVEKIAQALDNAQSGHERRCLTSEHVDDAIDAAEKALAKACVPKKIWIGVRIVLDPWGVPNRYRYRTDGTRATIERGSSGWFLVEARRVEVRPSSYGTDNWTPRVIAPRTEATVAAILRGSGIDLRP